jgi:N-acetylglucosaminylphosphatidylinositol deacetylase
MLIEIIVGSIIIINALVYLLLLLKPNKKKKSQNYCILIAHPDDEVLFFGPTILNLLKKGEILHVLCLTNGNYYGQGELREDELRNSCLKLNRNIIVKIVTKFHDSPSIEWDLDEVERTVTNYIKDNRIDYLITFDELGISLHANHRSLNKSILKIKQNNEKLIVYTLKTCFVLRKYFFIFDLIPTLIFDLMKKNSEKNLLFVSTPNDYILNIKAMFEHKTQLLWFRYLYIISSRYMFINYLVLIE